MTVISRLELDHPTLGTAGGSSLHASIAALYQKLGDNLNTRFFYVENLNDTATADVDHNFRVALSALRYDVYSWDTGTQELTLLTSATTPTRAQIPVTATPGFTTTQARMTNNSGSQQDLVIALFQDPIELDELADVTLTNPVSGEAVVWDALTNGWVNGDAGVRSAWSGFMWHSPSGGGAIEAEEFGHRVFLFADADSQVVWLQFRVSDAFRAGNPINMTFYSYSPSTSGNYRLDTTAYLVRPETDAADSTANSATATGVQNNPATANLVRESNFALTDGSGQINGIAVSIGDLIFVKLERTFSAVSDTADIRFMPDLTRVG